MNKVDQERGPSGDNSSGDDSSSDDSSSDDSSGRDSKASCSSKLKSYLHWALIALPLVLVWTYRLTLSKVLPPTCRFRPSCSHYALIALKSRGLLAGSILVVYRIMRCNPFCKSGHDPVPDRGWPNPPIPFEPAPKASAGDNSGEKLAS